MLTIKAICYKVDWRYFGGFGTMPKATSRTWALVVNGARCRIVRGVCGKGEDQPTELVLRSESRNLRDIMSDKPGRSFASMGTGRRSAMEYASDPVAEDQREFLRQIIALLESHRRADDFDRLAIFAEHDMLGHLRRMMPQTLADLVIREVPRNLLHHSVQDLAEAVSRELQDGSDIS
jgi:protein required for attachment to host cells